MSTKTLKNSLMSKHVDNKKRKKIGKLEENASKILYGNKESYSSDDICKENGTRFHFQINQDNLDNFGIQGTVTKSHLLENFCDTEDYFLLKNNKFLYLRMNYANPLDKLSEWILKEAKSDGVNTDGIEFEVYRGEEVVLSKLHEIWRQNNKDVPNVNKSDLTPKHFAPFCLASLDTIRYSLSPLIWIDISEWGMYGKLGMYAVLTIANESDKNHEKKAVESLLKDKNGKFHLAASKLFACLYHTNPNMCHAIIGHKDCFQVAISQLQKYPAIISPEQNVFKTLREFPKWEDDSDDNDDDNDDSDDEDQGV